MVCIDFGLGSRRNVLSLLHKLIPVKTLRICLVIGLQPSLLTATADIISLADENLSSCSWGLSFASMNHETQRQLRKHQSNKCYSNLMQYRRAKTPKATYFFTVVTYNRHRILCEPENVD